MKVLIKNLSNTYNYGSMMMGENLITYFNKYSNKDINYYVETEDISNIERLKKATGHDKIFQNKIIEKNSKSNNKLIRKLENMYLKNKLYNDYQKHYDYVYILGGDDYSEEYYDLKTEGRYVIHMLQDLGNLNKKVPVYMIGQTIGPYTGKRKKIASKVMNKINLYVRDKKNHDYLKEELNCNAHLMHDLAFLDLNLQDSINNEILNKYNLKKDNYITVVGTGLMHHYNDNDERFVEKFYDIIKILKNKYKDKKIVWLSHVVGKYSPDTKMLKLMLSKYKKLSKEITIIDDTLMPVEAREILGNGYFTISCRMHAAVSTFQMGKPCICLSYSPKFSGVIGKEFNMEKYIIESKNSELWEKDNDYIENKIKDLINDIDVNYTNITKNIKNRVKEIKKENLEIIKNIFKNMEV